MAVRVSGLNKLDSRIYYKKWSRNFMKEQSNTTRTVRKLLNDNPFRGLFGGNSKRIDAILKHYEKSFW